MSNTSTSSVRAKNKLVPKLRFPEFKSEKEWEENIVRDVVLYENGKAHEQDISDKGKYVVVNSKFISSDGEVRKFSNSAFCLANKNDVLMVLSDVPNGKAIAKCFLVDKENYYTVNQRICKLTPTSVNSEILFYLLNRNPFFLAFDDGVKQTNLRNEDVLNCPIILPPNPTEQQKIADCLSSLDDLITAENQKLVELKAHKKGLMQNLFPNSPNCDSSDEMMTMIKDKNHSPSKNHSSDNVPKLRFKEFEISGEWKRKTILDLAVDGFSNGVFNDPGKVGYGYKLINVADMYTDIPIDEENLSLIGISQSEFLKNKVEYGDIFFTRSSLVEAGIAQSNIYLGSSDDVTFDGHLVRLRPNKSIVDPKFLHYLLKTNSIRSQLIAKGKRATMTTIGQSDIATTNLTLPIIEEQQKITDCLSSLDDLITAQSQKIEALKEHKKGLMQGLFPKMSEL